MSAGAWMRAALAAALAFGVGYAARLAGAWAAGPTLVVVASENGGASTPAPASPDRATETSSSEARSSEATSHPAPDDDGAAPSTETMSTEADSFRSAMYESFARHHRVAQFRRTFDAVAVAPLGRTPEDLGLLDAGAAAPAPLVERTGGLRVRASAVRADAGPPTRSFQFVAFRRGGRFEVVVGDEGLHATLDPATTAAMRAAQCGKSLPGTPTHRHLPELARANADALLASCAAAHRAKEAARRTLWTRLADLAASGAAPALDPREVVGVGVADGKSVVFRVGDDPELDRLVDEADRLEREVRAEIESELRR